MAKDDYYVIVYKYDPLKMVGRSTYGVKRLKHT